MHGKTPGSLALRRGGDKSELYKYSKMTFCRHEQYVVIKMHGNHIYLTRKASREKYTSQTLNLKQLQRFTLHE